MIDPRGTKREANQKGSWRLDVDPNQGLGRALLAAVDQLSVATNHPELKTAPLLVLGFSGAGALVGRLVGFAPNRIATAILSHAGQVPPLNLDTINLSGAALKIPELIFQRVGDDMLIVDYQDSRCFSWARHSVDPFS